MHHSFHNSHSPLQSTMHPPIVVISKFRSQRKKHARSQTRVSEGPWKSETPFGPPHVPSFPGSGIRRIRNTLSKLSPAARAERELLRQKNRNKSPLTERNVTSFVSEQEFREIYYPTDNSTELQVTTWLEQLSWNWVGNKRQLPINQALATRKARVALLRSINNWLRFDYLDRSDLRQVPHQNTLGIDVCGVLHTTQGCRVYPCMYVWYIVDKGSSANSDWADDDDAAHSPFRPSCKSYLGIDVTWPELNCQRSTTDEPLEKTLYNYIFIVRGGRSWPFLERQSIDSSNMVWVG